MRRTIMGVVAYALLAAGASAQTQNTKDLLAQLEREQPIVCGGVVDKDACNVAFVGLVRAIRNTNKQTTTETVKASFSALDRETAKVALFYDEYELRKKGKASPAK